MKIRVVTDKANDLEDLVKPLIGAIARKLRDGDMVAIDIIVDRNDSDILGCEKESK